MFNLDEDDASDSVETDARVKKGESETAGLPAAMGDSTPSADTNDQLEFNQDIVCEEHGEETRCTGSSLMELCERKFHPFFFLSETVEIAPLWACYVKAQLHGGFLSRVVCGTFV